MTEISQGKWTRVRPLQRDELDPYTHAGMVAGELTWGNFKNNLCKVMAYLPKMLQTEIEYCNSFIFDPPTFRGEVQEAGFNDRFIKELVISKTSLINRSRYSITHHSFIGMLLFKTADREDEGHQKLLHLHEHQKHPIVYTERERTVLDFTANLTRDAHLVSNEQFEQLRDVLRNHTLRSNDRIAGMKKDDQDRFIDSQIVELTWLCGHFCLLNRFFTVLEVPDEGPDDEDNFLEDAYVKVVPENIRKRNEDVLQGGF